MGIRKNETYEKLKKRQLMRGIYMPTEMRTEKAFEVFNNNALRMF